MKESMPGLPKKSEAEMSFLGDLEARLGKTPEIKEVSDKLTTAGFEPYLVGGCLRDLLLDKNPKDWDVTTNATPDKILGIFPDSVYENSFGTVGVKTGSKDPRLALIEITTFRLEGKYTDKRHPDEIKFAKTVEEDLSRRDFTINAMAYEVSTHKRRASGLVDPFGGRKDLKNKLLRAVGNAKERFQEDALRLMRALRLASQLGFDIEDETAAAISEKSGLLEFIAKERIAGEFNKLLMTDGAVEGIRRMEKLGLLKYVMPELREGIDCEQNKHHKYTVFEHNLKALQYAVDKNFPLELRLASLLHDIGKPRARQWRDDPRGTKINKGHNGDWTFYQHQYIGEKMALQILGRLKYPKETIENVALLIREHMFVYDPEIVTPRGVRRMLSRVGADNINDLILLREADRIGSGVPKAQPYRLRSLKAAIEKAKLEPIHPKMLAINGNDIMELLQISPGPKIGQILAILLDGVLDDPKLNDKEVLLVEIKKLGALADSELLKLADESKKKAVDVQKRIDEEIDKKYFV
ncbi:MAG: HD domain-containing protein [bacterium]|nr:HD domain-containing protein [bacterium]